MKIQQVGNLEHGIRSLVNADMNANAVERPLVFRQALSSVSKEQFHSRMEALIGDIDKQAERLTKKADIKELERYRSLIRDFLNEVVSNGFEFTKDNVFESRGRYRFFATVRIIDEKLDNLAKDVLAEQADALQILHDVDDIRGLLLDMML